MGPASQPDRVGNPYLGPRPFTRNDAARFFGRDQEAADLHSLVAAHRTVLLYAQSGAGKTSLLNAGLIPRLESGGFDVLPIARVSGIRGDDPLYQGFNIYAANCVLNWSEKTAPPETTLIQALEHRPRRTRGSGEPAPRVAVLDQFEELFTAYPARWTERAPFFEELDRALAVDKSLRLLVVIREDYMAHLDPYEELLPEELRTRYRLEKLRAGDALAAVERPLEGTGIHFREGVAQHLVNDLLRTPVSTTARLGPEQTFSAEYVEPVQLQVVCFNLFRNLPEGTLEITEDHLTKFGDVNQALREFYNSALTEAAAKSGVRIDDLRRWFEKQLITESGTRGLVFRGGAATGGIANQAVDALEALHIIRAELRGGDRWYELSHDRFIQPVLRANDSWRERVQRRAFAWKWARIAGVVAAGLFAIIALVVIYAVDQKRRAEQAVADGLLNENKILRAQVTPAAAPSGGSPAPSGAAPTASPVGFSVPELTKLYHFPPGLNGEGQTIALVELGGGYKDADLKSYFGALQQPVPKVQWVSVDGAKNAPTGDPNGADSQVVLDIEVAGAAAPGAQIVAYFAPNTNKGFIDAVQTAAHDTHYRVSIISMGWGSAESYWPDAAIQALNQALQDAASRGITVIAAAGDSGVTDGATDRQPHVDFPASSPFVLAVGGTRLTVSGEAITREVVWNNAENGGATGGGVSSKFALPDWQAKINVAPLNGGKPGRAIPDVAGNADPATGVKILVNGRRIEIGGTTITAPLWAGLIALLNQGLGHNLGYFNPLLYSTVGPAGALRDITEGNNSYGGVMGYSAGPGWDAVSGWGSPDGTKLLEALRAKK